MYRILIVEDDISIAGSLKRHIETWGFEVRCVESFQKVMEDFSEFDPHLVLLDIILPLSLIHI